MIPLDMFSFMTGRSDWLAFLFCKDFWSVLHMAEVSPVGSNTSVCLACLACCRQRCSILCSSHQLLGHRNQAPELRTFLELAQGKLKAAAWFLQLGFHPAGWKRRRSRFWLAWQTASRGGSLPMEYAPLAFCPGRFYYFLFNVGILSRVLPVRSFPHVCSFLVSRSNGAAWNSL